MIPNQIHPLFKSFTSLKVDQLQDTFVATCHVSRHTSQALFNIIAENMRLSLFARASVMRMLSLTVTQPLPWCDRRKQQHNIVSLVWLKNLIIYWNFRLKLSEQPLGGVIWVGITGLILLYPSVPP